MLLLSIKIKTPLLIYNGVFSGFYKVNVNLVISFKAKLGSSSPIKQTKPCPEIFTIQKFILFLGASSNLDQLAQVVKQHPLFELSDRQQHKYFYLWHSPNENHQLYSWWFLSFRLKAGKASIKTTLAILSYTYSDFQYTS